MKRIRDDILVSAKMNSIPSVIKVMGSLVTLARLETVLRQQCQCLGLVFVLKVIVLVLVASVLFCGELSAIADLLVITS